MLKLFKRSNLSLLFASRFAFVFGALIILCGAATSDRIGLEEKSQGQAVTANDPSETSSPPPPAAPISEPKEEAEQGQARLLYDLSYSKKCKTLPDPAITESAGLFEQFKEDEQFATLRDARQKITQAIQQATSESALIKSKMDGLSRIMSTPRSVAISEASVLEQLNEQRLQYQKIVDALSDELKRPSTANAADQNKIDAVRMNLRTAQTSLELTDQKIENENRRRMDLQKEKEEQNKQDQNISLSLSNTQKDLQLATNDLECANALENKIDSEIYSLLVPQTQRNQFKLLMSGLFALMVLVVILGLFTVALRDSDIRSAIFSNQTGIQFVTLFSLVIAIILFGITEILQAKELSALLGGISGYILGRVTTDRNTSPPAPPAATPAEARKD